MKPETHAQPRLVARACGYQTDFADVQHVTCQRCFKVSHIARVNRADFADGTIQEKFGGPCEHCGNLLSMDVTYAK